MNCNADESKPKYACQVCGSTRLRSELNAFKSFTVTIAGRKLKLGIWEIYGSNSDNTLPMVSSTMTTACRLSEGWSVARTNLWSSIHGKC